MISGNFVYVTALLSLIGEFVYIRATLYGKTQPNRVTFLLWAIIPFISIAVSLSQGAGLSVVPVFMVGFGPLLIFIASFFSKNGYWKLGTLDYVCGILSVLAIIFWLSVKAPNTAIIFAILADALAAVPTLVKAWKHPETETGFMYMTPVVGNIVGLLVIRMWKFTIYGFGMYSIVINLILLGVIYRKRLFKFFGCKKSVSSV